MTKIRCWIPDTEIGKKIMDKLTVNYSAEVKCYLASYAILPGIAWLKTPEKRHAFVDVVSLDAGKENAINCLLRTISPQEKIITVGDDTNDLGMIKEFDGYAMEHSVPEVLANVDSRHVVKSVTALIESLNVC